MAVARWRGPPAALRADADAAGAGAGAAASRADAPVAVVDGAEAYAALLRAAGERLVVVKVFAPWCRSCRALEPKVARLAREFAGDGVLFAKLDFEKNRELCDGLGVSAMPTFVFHKGRAGVIDQFSCGPQRAAVIRAKIAHVLDGVCLLDEKPA